MEHKKGFNVGDVIPLDQAEKSDTYFLVTINGQRYLVDKRGKVVLRQIDPASGLGAVPASPSKTAVEAEELTLKTTPRVEQLKLRLKPGTPEFTSAVLEAEGIMAFFLDQVRRNFRRVVPRFEAYLEQTRTPYVKYVARDRDGLANMKAYLIRELFSRSTALERGLEIVEFLTVFIARKLDGSFSHDRNLPPVEQKTLVMGFLNFIGDLGDTPARKSIFEQTYEDFINQEYELMKSDGGAGYYISSSLQKSLKAQLEFLATPETRNYLEASYQKLVRTQLDFFLDNMLSYVKALAILRLMSHSRKEERGRDDEEREAFFYEIIVFKPGWYNP